MGPYDATDPCWQIWVLCAALYGCLGFAPGNAFAEQNDDTFTSQRLADGCLSGGAEVNVSVETTVEEDGDVNVLIPRA